MRKAIHDCEHGRRSNLDDDIWLLCAELNDKSFQPTGVAFPAKEIDLRCAAVLVAKLVERFEQQMDRRKSGKSAVKNTDPRPLLRASRERPGGRRTAEKCHEISSLHVSPVRTIA